ncbi:WASH complex subunit 2 [Maniola jurtina]|uniref:WASH complex subunit 2 n=1 Tax=Maniola jurtina TaxID=191418 RepID=UPI001E686438|nr:WASH complex subunit 2 [Maniola jurtina]XP_045770075.1 WASH complex subunit 2 [Maniola jurtina]XP_045770076.1 WASH complex subunit 2 [Maniola jurtina]XP_045770077.1 WASH complex subunit 2 [Maniola jurtina]XP_045770078.1 WASH complex subunit 2 [Maniola jurtina]
MEADTASLRKAAPNWNLAGDKQLLEMLQKIHLKIMTKCEEANVKLDAMVDALDNASIDLQNVNNKFMALSNSQFVESRVYDDDVDVSTAENIAKVETLKVDAESEITKLKSSLQRLEQMHEPVHILDSDSSDEEDDGRIILKPKEIYSHRPLPYIIGSQAWKNKWHAGLIQEESDSDSSVSKQDNIGIYNDEYSESEPETAPTDKLAHRTISSSSMESELTSQPQATSEVTRQPAKPADIAAELARRLGGQPVQLPASEPVPIQTPPEPTTTKVYRVEKPAPTTIFSDEPPPLDDYQSYKSDYTDDDDIFAELHKKPNPNTNRSQNRVTKDLFGGLNDNIVDDLFGEVETRDNDIGNVDYQDDKSSARGREKTPLFDERQKSNLVTEKPLPKQKPIETKAETEGAVKKPVGGISLFGSNKGAESIGAAILKRNQRKSSTSDEDTSNTENKGKAPSIEKTNEEPVNKIIKDLFSKPTKKVIKKEETKRKEEVEKVKPAKDKIDLFSDNLFDDIDDIFTTNIVTKPKDHKSQKSIFDDDDLFADIAIKKSEERSDKSDTKNVFDSNDDLFSENENTLNTEVKIRNNPTNVDKNAMIAKETVNDKLKSDNKSKQTASKSLFDDDSEDDLFSDAKTVGNVSKSQNPIIENVKEAEDITLESNHKSLSTKTVINDVNNLLNKLESKSLSQSINSKSQLESPSLFDDDEFDDIFTAPTKSSTEQNKLNNPEDTKHIIIEDTKNTGTIESNKTGCKEEISRINDNIAEIRQTAHIENKISETRDIAKTNIMVGETKNSYISDDKAKSKLSQPEEIFADVNEIVDQKQDTRSSYFADVDDDLKKPEHFKHSETSNEDAKNILPPDLIPECSKLEPTEPSVLSDIFTDLPPEFEKPLEPKKSKNVNALFDDDSDDEALFFKKNEPISDEKPELNFDSDRFRIFHDEPPEIDVDFSQKPLKNTPNTFDELTDDESFGDSPTSQAQQPVKNVEIESVKEVNEPHKNVFLSSEDKITNAVDITKLIEDSKESEKNQETNVSDLLVSFEENTKMNLSEDISDKPEVSESETLANKDLIEETEQVKLIGKLKPMNFNINVNSLLPGASLKKSKTSEETDGQAISTKSNEELNIHSSEKTESKMVKSVSFDGDPDSEILDNKLSKHRAKIQVKRRPSSRRARLEAVRKSRIELASDSTDNSSSFDEPPYKEIVNRERLDGTVDSTITQTKSSSGDTFKENASTLDMPDTTDVINPSLPETLLKERDNFIGTKITQPDVKSKVVYILNDEDIFNDIDPKKEDNNGSKKVHNKNVLNVIDDDDESLFKTPNISTLGKTYENKTVSSSDDLKPEPKTTVSKESLQKASENVKDNNLPKTKKLLFDDLSDDENELFGGNKKPAIQKANIFDSDSEGELFIKSKRESATVELKKEAVKGSLFGDESDDDSDLFSVKAKKTSGNVRQHDIQKPKEVAAKTSEPVFEDPLSMFGDVS